ncbi:MAG: flagellar basal body L-ring protein FlgH [Fidelibacterota bacterium]|nr:MAG: flagellar basal body L-ring protein FlgH [Candidatus Neomarinimicrobiota bacterium]UCH09878.1 MAG: flagellar basal body L-ring protein FlgH [Candidatus Neomarinimicrobiota bacterium]
MSSSVVRSQDAPLSLYADHKARGTGDVVTILVMETSNASHSSQVQKFDDNSVNAQGDVQGNLLQFLPVFGLQSNLKTDSNSREGTAQKDLLTGRITAVITEVTDNGMYKITGTKVINVNGERNLMTVKGTIRPRDIRSDNTVLSYNIADSRLYYSKAGVTGKLVQRGTFSRLANIIMGGAGLAIIGYVGGVSALTIIRSLSF